MNSPIAVPQLKPMEFPDRHIAVIVGSNSNNDLHMEKNVYPQEYVQIPAPVKIEAFAQPIPNSKRRGHIPNTLTDIAHMAANKVEMLCKPTQPVKDCAVLGAIPTMSSAPFFVERKNEPFPQYIEKAGCIDSREGRTAYVKLEAEAQQLHIHRRSANDLCGTCDATIQCLERRMHDLMSNLGQISALIANQGRQDGQWHSRVDKRLSEIEKSFQENKLMTGPLPPNTLEEMQTFSSGGFPPFARIREGYHDE